MANQDLPQALRELSRVSAPSSVEARVMTRVNQRTVFGLPARQWAVVAASLGGWAFVVQGVVGWTVTSIGG